MRKGSADQRKEEIINACEQLYQELDFKDIHIKMIGERVSFGRTSIYNYFQTKEEIFLALVEREYLRWNEDLKVILNVDHTLNKEEFIEKVTESLLKRKTLLKLISMNMFEMESKSSIECITKFKLAFKESVSLLKQCLCLYFDVQEKEAERIIFTFLPFLVGIYPYTSVTEKMREAILQADFDYHFYTDEEMIKMGLENILGGL